MATPMAFHSPHQPDLSVILMSSYHSSWPRAAMVITFSCCMVVWGWVINTSKHLTPKLLLHKFSKFFPLWDFHLYLSHTSIPWCKHFLSLQGFLTVFPPSDLSSSIFLYGIRSLGLGPGVSSQQVYSQASLRYFYIIFQSKNVYPFLCPFAKWAMLGRSVSLLLAWYSKFGLG